VSNDSEVAVDDAVTPEPSGEEPDGTGQDGTGQDGSGQDGSEPTVDETPEA
jgi:hypothetical protein